MQRPAFCNHVDYPCCGCGDDTPSPEMIEEMEAGIGHFGGSHDSYPDDDIEGVDFEEGCAPEDDGMTDVEADADTLRCAGWGTDEDYFLGERYDDQFEIGGES